MNEAYLLMKAEAIIRNITWKENQKVELYNEALLWLREYRTLTSQEIALSMNLNKDEEE